MVRAHDSQDSTGLDGHQIVQPCEDLDELRARLARAAKLGPASPLRIGLDFLRETDSDLS